MAAVLDTWDGKIWPVLSVQFWRTREAVYYLTKGYAPTRGQNGGSEGRLLILIPEQPRKAAPENRGSTVPPANRQRGPKPPKLHQVIEAMRAAGGLDAVKWEKEESLVRQFGASRDTCRKARKLLESEFVEKQSPTNSDN